MTVLPTHNQASRRWLSGVILLIVCALGGTFDILNDNFARWVARIAAFPEEEEVQTKDRSVLAAAQPSRRGTLRPGTRVRCPTDGRRTAGVSGPGTHCPGEYGPPFLTGAGIFQRC